MLELEKKGCHICLECFGILCNTMELAFVAIGSLPFCKNLFQPSVPMLLKVNPITFKTLHWISENHMNWVGWEVSARDGLKITNICDKVYISIYDDCAHILDCSNIHAWITSFAQCPQIRLNDIFLRLFIDWKNFLTESKFSHHQNITHVSRWMFQIR